MRRIDGMDIDYSCWLYVYATHAELPTAHLTEAMSRCRIVRQKGFWLRHFFSVPEAELTHHDYVFMLIDSVELSASVDLRLLTHIMQTNCLDQAGPACSSCLTKREINHDYRFAVGRSTWYIDPQA